ncbi:MAG: hypothetical protein ACE15C_14605 [Phycisphaerae bacterium]
MQLKVASGQLAGRMHAGRLLIDPGANVTLRLAAGATAPAPALADDRFARGLASLSDSQRQALLARQAMVKSYLAAMDERPAGWSVMRTVEAWLGMWNAQHPGKPVCQRTIYNWARRYKRDGLAGLVDMRGGRRIKDEFPPEVRHFIVGQLREGCTSLVRIHERATLFAREKGLPMPAVRTVQQWVRSLPPALVACLRDPRRFRDRTSPHITRDWSRVHSMECWVADHRQLDVLVPRRVWIERPVRKGRDGLPRASRGGRWEVRFYRPWLTMFLDARSWMPVGWVLDFDEPNANRVMTAFMRAVAAHGCPEHLILDNGKDFRARDFAGGRQWRKLYAKDASGRLRAIRRGEKLLDEQKVGPLLQALGVEVHWATPYNARAKIVENFFRIMSLHFDRMWPTYCGSRAEKRAIWLRKLHADRIQDDYNIDLVRAGFEAWVMEDYALRQCPNQDANPGLSSLRAFHEGRRPNFSEKRPPDHEMALLLSKSVKVCVRGNGIIVSAFGLPQWYWSDHPEFQARVGAAAGDVRKAISYRAMVDDPSRVFVFDYVTDKFLCIAEPRYQMHPLASSAADREKLGGEIALQRSFARDTKAVAGQAKRFYRNQALELMRRAGEAAGCLDDPATIVKRYSATVLTMVGGGELSRAAAAGARHDEERQASAKARMREFFARAQTGTDAVAALSGAAGQVPSANGVADPLDVLYRKADCDDAGDRNSRDAT